jgi:hypothetical protein
MPLVGQYDPSGHGVMAAMAEPPLAQKLPCVHVEHADCPVAV